ncbi:hypothetical protein EIP91_009774 [Steccherinum ochraceum]|uniref:Uncharacterized protein n=1 Tax=Steccherinum ochraceum TaxID=92696 RepID=A0A4R0RAJ9_9APHY|nr:hypothetical protein EIP91_009774 [Steccherinum ochraceum]
MAPAKFQFAPKYQWCTPRLKQSPPDSTAMVEYGLKEVDTCDIAASVPLMIYGYMLPYSWMAAFAKRNGGELCRRFGVNPESGTTTIAEHVAGSMMVALKLRVIRRYMIVPARNDNVVILGIISNAPGKLESLTRETDRRRFEDTKKSPMDCLEMEEEPRWFISTDI